MSETTSFDIDTDGLRRDLGDIREAVGDLVERDLLPLADTVEQTFADVGRSITDNLSDAAEKGRLSVRELVNDVLADLTRLAADQLIRQPLEGVLTGIFGGARAGGGAVSPGAAYLVGERGPELFVPSASGAVGPATSRPVTVNISMTSSGPDPIGRSEAQLAGTVQRALSRALRNA